MKKKHIIWFGLLIFGVTTFLFANDSRTLRSSNLFDGEMLAFSLGELCSSDRGKLKVEVQKLKDGIKVVCKSDEKAVIKQLHDWADVFEAAREMHVKLKKKLGDGN